MTPLRVLLRGETRDAHEALHRLPVFRRLARSAICRAEYGDLLQRMEFFYAALDTALVAACRQQSSGTGNAVHALRAPLIARDLAALGMPTARAEPLRLPELDEPAAIAGALYVVDGAVLGGATLGRAVQRLDWPAPCGFWSWCRTDGPAIWRRTLALIERIDRGPASRAVALATAAATFAAFGHSVGQLSPEPSR